MTAQPLIAWKPGYVSVWALNGQLRLQPAAAPRPVDHQTMRGPSQAAGIAAALGETAEAFGVDEELLKRPTRDPQVRRARAALVYMLSRLERPNGQRVLTDAEIARRLRIGSVDMVERLVAAGGKI